MNPRLRFKSKLFFAGLLFLPTTLVVGAVTSRSPDSIFGNTMVAALETYSQQHRGKLPESWEDLEPSYLFSDESFAHLHPAKRYAFLEKPFPLKSPLEGNLILVTRRPYSEIEVGWNWYGASKLRPGEPGRRIVYRLKDGRFRHTFVDEKYIQELFRGSESLLPRPDTEPERPWINNLRSKGRFWKMSIFGILLLGLGFWGGKKARRAWKAAP